MSGYDVRLSYNIGGHMIFDITRMSSKGQIVIPAEMRKRMGLRAGSGFCIVSDGKNLMLEQVMAGDMPAFKALKMQALEITRKSKKARSRSPAVQPVV